ncbi:protein kinase domain-containing protein [Nodularia sp. UHCC 0506]|uniref:protein kinase domain-containing protein n=1 Tax=Nodularia sp. UHCC 0506 TaxID=3110243 RepID=UPI002B1FEE8F|nr:protein kinase [Nodularia sp. UHCC 0506]MEA5517216.1 protein kinase [Nodularia sp. UHCC 0506]
MKVLKWGNSKFVELFEQESRTLRRLNHPCIPGSTIDDFFTFVPNNSPLTLRCLVMDKIEGQNLQKWIQSNGRISESLAVKWLKHLVEILDLVHHTEFFHRDIKPANIILQPDGRLALVDFGAARRITDTYLAKVSASGGTSTRMGNYEITAIVSPGYTPLEQINGKAVPQSDFYALGRTFVYLTTAIPLVKLPTDENTGQLNWRNKAPQIGKRFADLIDEMMAPFPGQRPQTNEIILHRLKKLPSQTNFDKFVKSKTFIFIVIGLVSFTGIGMFNVLLPVIANYFVSQGQNLETKKQAETAQKFFNWAIKIDHRTNQTISSFYFEKAGRNFRNLQLAKTYYEKASQYNPQDVDIYRNLALVCQYLNQFECVINNYEKALKIRDNDWELHYELGNFYDQANKYDLAEKQYKIAIKLNKEAAAPINNLSRLKNREGNYHESEALARQGLNLTEKPEIKTTLYKNLGWAKLGQQEYIEANKYLQKSLEIDATKTDTYCLLAQVQDAVDETTNARISWEVCMIAESSLPEVLIWRQQLLDRLSKN